MLKDILTLMLAIVLSFTTGGSVQDEKMNDSVFQMETIHSFDGRLRVDIDATEMMVRLDITDEESGELLYSFSPVRRWDFWGICFETDSYNLWVKSGDVGILCYEYDGETWQYNPDAVMPDYIEQGAGTKKPLPPRKRSEDNTIRPSPPTPKLPTGWFLVNFDFPVPENPEFPRLWRNRCRAESR